MVYTCFDFVRYSTFSYFCPHLKRELGVAGGKRLKEKKTKKRKKKVAHVQKMGLA